jgi:hypothetical protein
MIHRGSANALSIDNFRVHIIIEEPESWKFRQDSDNETIFELPSDADDQLFDEMFAASMKRLTLTDVGTASGIEGSGYEGERSSFGEFQYNTHDSETAMESTAKKEIVRTIPVLKMNTSGWSEAERMAFLKEYGVVCLPSVETPEFKVNCESLVSLTKQRFKGRWGAIGHSRTKEKGGAEMMEYFKAAINKPELLTAVEKLRLPLERAFQDLMGSEERMFWYPALLRSHTTDSAYIDAQEFHRDYKDLSTIPSELASHGMLCPFGRPISLVVELGAHKDTGIRGRFVKLETDAWCPILIHAQAPHSGVNYTDVEDVYRLFNYTAVKPEKVDREELFTRFKEGLPLISDQRYDTTKAKLEEHYGSKGVGGYLDSGVGQGQQGSDEDNNSSYSDVAGQSSSS